MALVFGTNCDSSLNESITNTPPDTASNVTVDTTNSKFGAGSAKFTYSASLIWRNFAIDPLDNNGAVGIWLYFDSTKRAIYRFEIHEEVGGGTTTNQVQILVDNRYLGSKLRLYLHMRDNAGVYWININDTALSYVAPGWHYLELNWLWNDASGITELSWDGNVRISSTAGNTKDRSGGTSWYIHSTYTTGTTGHIIHTDDKVIFNERLHTGNFTPPSSSQVVTGPAGGPIVFGYPFGMRSFSR